MQFKWTISFISKARGGFNGRTQKRPAGHSDLPQAKRSSPEQSKGPKALPLASTTGPASQPKTAAEKAFDASRQTAALALFLYKKKSVRALIVFEYPL